MDVAYIVVAVIFALMLTISAMGKFRKMPQVVDMIVTKVGVPESWLLWLGAAEIAGAVGLLIGIAWRPLGVAAGVGVTLYFVGAVIAHLRAHDPAWQSPLVLAIFGVVVTGLAVASL